MADLVTFTIEAIDNTAKAFVSAASNVQRFRDRVESGMKAARFAMGAAGQAVNMLSDAYRALSDEFQRIGDPEAVASINELNAAFQSLTAVGATSLEPMFVGINTTLRIFSQATALAVLGIQRLAGAIEETTGLKNPFIDALTEEEYWTRASALAQGELGKSVEKTTAATKKQADAIGALSKRIKELQSLRMSEEEAIRKGDALALSRVQGQISDLGVTGSREQAVRGQRGAGGAAGASRGDSPIIVNVMIGKEKLSEQIYEVLADGGGSDTLFGASAADRSRR